MFWQPPSNERDLALLQLAERHRRVRARLDDLDREVRPAGAVIFEK
jgi:hypothetical protein